MKHTMPELPYAPEALAPKMSKETFDYHVFVAGCKHCTRGKEQSRNK